MSGKAIYNKQQIEGLRADAPDFAPDNNVAVEMLCDTALALLEENARLRAVAGGGPKFTQAMGPLEEMLGQLVDHVRKRDPQLDAIKAEFEDGAVVTLKLKGKRPKRHPMQKGATMTETRPRGYYDRERT